MTKNKSLTNQELLTELKSRLSHFTYDEFVTLLMLLQKHQDKITKFVRSVNPKIYDWCQEKAFQLRQEKTDESIDKLKKSLQSK